MNGRNTDNSEPATIQRENATELEARLTAFLQRVLSTWQDHPGLNLVDVLAIVQNPTAQERPDQATSLLLGRLTTRTAPTSPEELAERAEAAVGETIQRLLAHGPPAGRRPKEKGTEDERESHEEQGEPELPSRSDIVLPAAEKRFIREILLSIRAPQEQPLSGTTEGVTLGDGDRFFVYGFNSVSPPEQIPIEYLAFNERYTGTAAADQASALHIAINLTFEVKKWVRSYILTPIPRHEITLIKADFTLTFDRQAYYVMLADHVDIRQLELVSPRRFADISLTLGTQFKKIPGDVANLRLSLHIRRDTDGAIIYFIRWSCVGQLLNSDQIATNGQIRINTNGRLVAEDKATETYFGLPRPS
ncbi:hypothetical protein [Amycolatopsis sp. H20-H5]|uniref:hypothetical protein n=1 Tax=Amycolatopsis sp. H20-H5 TaxID=3046309 RepID=UPI002DB7419C|nr:hypothetical protein [Amycolatopsis sp. H20-H5]MEC3978745.1 hypothetical protein [Amycolatopsis sp. H20-H5]